MCLRAGWAFWDHEKGGRLFGASQFAFSFYIGAIYHFAQHAASMRENAGRSSCLGKSFSN